MQRQRRILRQQLHIVEIFLQFYNSAKTAEITLIPEIFRKSEGNNGIVEHLEGNVGMAGTLHDDRRRGLHRLALPPLGIPEIGQNPEETSVLDVFDANSLD